MTVIMHHICAILHNESGLQGLWLKSAFYGFSLLICCSKMKFATIKLMICRTSPNDKIIVSTVPPPPDSLYQVHILPPPPPPPPPHPHSILCIKCTCCNKISIDTFHAHAFNCSQSVLQALSCPICSQSVLQAVPGGGYHIYPAIRQGFCPSRMTSNNLSVL